MSKPTASRVFLYKHARSLNIENVRSRSTKDELIKILKKHYKKAKKQLPDFYAMEQKESSTAKPAVKKTEPKKQSDSKNDSLEKDINNPNVKVSSSIPGAASQPYKTSAERFADYRRKQQIAENKKKNKGK